MKNKKKIADSHPDGCICKQLVYLPYLRVYPNNSDMNELGDISRKPYKEDKE